MAAIARLRASPWLTMPAGLAALALASLRPPGWMGFALVLLGLTLAMYRGLASHRRLAWRVWREAHLRPEGPLAAWFSGAVWTRLSCGVAAGFYASAVYVTLQVARPGELVLVTLCALGGELAVRRLRAVFETHLRASSALLYGEAAVFHACIGALVVGLALLRFATDAGLPAGLTDSASLSAHVVRTVHHPVHLVQSICRTMVYADLQLRLVRDNGAVGHVLYLVFLLPNLVPLRGMIWFLRGLKP